MNILIIDDNKDITDAISLYGESQGHLCTVFNDGKKGYEELKKHGYELILLDIAMPGLSGFDILNKLKGNGDFNMKKIVVITASNMDEHSEEKFNELGIFQLVKKPMTLELLQSIFSKF